MKSQDCASASLATTTSKDVAKRKPPSPTLCEVCVKVRDDPLFNRPTHLVHPVSGDHMLFDVHGTATCPTCGARWRRILNYVELVAGLK